VRALRPLGPLLAVGLIAVAFLPLADPVDLQVFVRAGGAVLHGRALYPHVGTPAVYSGASFVYPYLAAWPFVPLSLLSGDAASTVFFLLCAVAVIGATLAVTDGDWWAATAVLCTAFTVTGLQLGALSPLLFAGVVLMWHLRDRPLAFALIAAPVVASKLFLVPLLLWPLATRRYRAFAWACALTAAVLLVGFVLGPIGPTTYAHLLSSLSTHESRSGFGLVGALRNHLGLSAPLAQLAAVAAAIGVLAAGYLRYRSSERALFVVAVLAALVLTPVLWSHYLVLLLAVPLVLQAPRRWLLALAVASWAIAPPHDFDPETPLLYDVTKSVLWFSAAALALNSRFPRRGAARAAPETA
jgi:alpha-1,2-mannosyltransferase